MRARLSLSLALGGALALAACSVSEAEPPEAAAAEAPELMRWPALLERPRPAPDETIRYGADPLQVVDFWRPAGRGPHPVVMMVHGGCWQTEIADRTIMNWIADDLRKRGIAVWNIDYRGVDREGGGYPGTFHDVAAAADALSAHAERLSLDTSKVVAVGHSAGGHLALWLAARHSDKAKASNPLIPRGSPLLGHSGLPLAAVVSLGGIPDLELAATPPGSGCGTEVIEKLVGPPSLSSRNVYGDTSIPRLAPLGVPQILINGRQDKIIPTSYADSYAAQMRKAGDEVKVRMLDQTGHVELIAPETAAWAAAVKEIEAALGR
jgi:acetyl esterase/lipase